jgi:hypothetical protein
MKFVREYGFGILLFTFLNIIPQNRHWQNVKQASNMLVKKRNTNNL